MRKTILSFMLAATVYGWAADNNLLHVIVNYPQAAGDTLICISANNTPYIGKEGKFEFDLDASTVRYETFATPATMRGDSEFTYAFKLPVVPEDSVIVTSTGGDEYNISGPGFYNEYYQVGLFMDESLADINSLMLKRDSMIEQGVNTDSVNNFTQEQFVPLFERFKQQLLDYISTHASQEASVTLIPYLSSLDEMNQAVQLLDPAVREGRVKPLYKDNIDEIEMQEAKQAEAAQKQAEGITAPDFTLNDINGQPLSLSSLRGKYVVLDFWGSWCIWCIKGFPDMKTAYEKYKGKFEIVGIDCNDSEAKWKAAVEKHQLPWLHVYNPRTSSLLDDYAIQGFPTKIIVGPDGKIVKTIVGEDPSFYTLLDSLFE